jgi:hypothetical protein
MSRPNDLSKAPLDAVAHDGVSDATANHHSHPGRLVVFAGRRRAHEQRVRPTLSVGAHPLKIGTSCETVLSAHWPAGHALLAWIQWKIARLLRAIDQRAIGQMVSRLRPRRRRRRSTFRPPGEAMRFIKPCSRFRGIRFGW